MVTADRFGWRAKDVVKLPPREKRSAFFDPMAPGPIFPETRVAGKGGQFAKGGGRVPGRGKPGGAASLSPSTLRDFETPAGASTWSYLESDGAGGTRFNAERTALHERIIEERLSGIAPPSGRPPEVIMLGGGPGAGKSTSSAQLGVPPVESKKAAWADPDHFKQQLPEYDPKNPGPVHEESSYLAREMTRRAHERGLDVVIDGVGDNPASVHAKLATARSHGATTRAVYSTTDVETAQIRNQLRDRSVEPSLLQSKHAAVSRNFREVADGDFDSVELWANSGYKGGPAGGPPVRVAHKTGAGTSLIVDDAGAWSAFLAKADLS